ncbi:MAG: efflux RND transporter periplasmic adaptor subunit [Betaproteobacteria bacterium]|nr:efflux RND transporter periplasmic adaptor subunit [Betaproteobacteria bacterium]
MKPFWIVFVVLVAAAGGGYYWWNHQAAAKSQGTEASEKAEGKAKGRKGRGGPVSVRTITPKRQPMPVLIDAVGTVESQHSVAVHPQVSGVLTAVRFKEGDYVKKGQVLFEIDPRPMRAAVEQSQAAVRRDEAQLAQARAQEERLRSLVDKDYITRQEYDVAATSAKSLEATVNANRAALDQAQLHLAYSRIVAPISGRTGSLGVRAGNLVSAGTGGSPLVVINSTRPILVAIPVPQRHLDDVRKQWGSLDLKVEIAADRGEQTLVEGRLIFIDNAVNPATGTILLKAEVPNEKEQLWPGQFLAARIVLRIEPDAMVLPEGAIQPGQEGPFVFVAADGRARVKDVVVDRQIGEQVVIAQGLEGNERIIIEVPPTLAANSPVVLAGESGRGKGKGKGKGKVNAESAPAGAPSGASEPATQEAAKTEERQ